MKITFCFKAAWLFSWLIQYTINDIFAKSSNSHSVLEKRRWSARTDNRFINYRCCYMDIYQKRNVLKKNRKNTIFLFSLDCVCVYFCMSYYDWKFLPKNSSLVDVVLNRHIWNPVQIATIINRGHWFSLKSFV